MVQFEDGTPQINSIAKPIINNPLTINKFNTFKYIQSKQNILQGNFGFF